MKISPILFTLLFLPSLAFSQAWKLDSVIYEQNTYLLYPRQKIVGQFIDVNSWMIDTNYYDQGLPVDGAWIQFYKEDSLQPARIWEYKNKSKDGFWNEFHPNGEIKVQGSYANGKMHGKWDSYYSSGQIKSINYYENGSSIGNWTVFFENGDIDREGVADSIYTEYYKNGNKKSEFLIYDSEHRKNEWYENGQLRNTQTFIDGYLKDTIQTYYYENGQIELVGSTKHGTFSGVCKYYYENGQLYATGKHSTFETISTDFFPTPKFISFNSGKWVYYYETGEILAKGTYKAKPKTTQPGTFSRDKVEPVKENNWKYFDKQGNETEYNHVKEFLKE